MGTDRRKFLKGVATGSAGLFAGRILPGFSSCCIERNSNYDRINSDFLNPVFPFYKYITEYSIGEYIPKDQGGKFIQMELIGSEDDKLIVEAIRKGLIGKYYGDPVVWNKFEKTEIEKSVWLNRFYFFPSFARLFYLTGDRSYLNDMLAILTKWINDNPLLADSSKTTYNWRDMQAAWRSIHLSWCYYLGYKGLTSQERGLIINTLNDHSSVLISGFGTQPLNEFNHQSHGALAMLYLGVLFPELKKSDVLISSALKILNHHLTHAFYSDGGNVEQMFGYYPFEAHIFRDTFLLLKENNMDLPETIQPMLKKMADFIVTVAQPDGTMPPVNDSYEMPVAPIVATLYTILGKAENLPVATSHYFAETQIAVLRSNRRLERDWYIIANPAMTIGSHAHAGRLAFNLWYNNKPCLIDSGCGSYDDPLLAKWYRTSKAHNTVLIDGKSDAATSGNQLWVAKRTTQNRIEKWESKQDLTLCRMLSPSSESVNSGVKWTRCIMLVKDLYTVLYDCFESDQFHKYEIIFHFPPSEVKIDQEEKTFMMIDGIALVPANKSEICNLNLYEGIVSVGGVSTKAPVGSFFIEGNGTIHSVIVIMPVEKAGKIKLSSKFSDEEAWLKAEDEDGHIEKTVFS